MWATYSASYGTAQQHDWPDYDLGAVRRMRSVLFSAFVLAGANATTNAVLLLGFASGTDTASATSQTGAGIVNLVLALRSFPNQLEMFGAGLDVQVSPSNAREQATALGHARKA